MAELGGNGEAGRLCAFLESRILIGVARASMALLIPAMIWVHASIEDSKVAIASHTATLQAIDSRLTRIESSLGRPDPQLTLARLDAAESKIGSLSAAIARLQEAILRPRPAGSEEAGRP